MSQDCRGEKCKKSENISKNRILELRLFWAAGIVMVLAALWFYHAVTLRRPVFLLMNVEDVMFEAAVSEESDFEEAADEIGEKWLWRDISVYYIQDREDAGRIASVGFPELEGIGEFWPGGWMNQETWSLFDAWSGSDFQSRKYGIYEISGKIRILEKNWPEEGIHLSRIQVSYADGRTEEEQIGDLYLRRDSDSEILQMESVGSSSDGTQRFFYRVRRDCRLDKITMSSPELVRREFDVQINGVDLWEWKPMELKEGERLCMEISWHGSGEIREALEPMTVMLELHCAGTEGGANSRQDGESVELVPIKRFLYWGKGNFWKVRRYLTERGAYEAGN